MSTPIHTGRRPRRYLDMEGKTLVPDSLRLEDGTFIWNPEWETAPYEVTFFLNGKNLRPYDPVELSKNHAKRPIAQG
jgi:hypothetical protein